MDNNNDNAEARKLMLQHKRFRKLVIVSFMVFCVPFGMVLIVDYLSNPAKSPLGPQQATELRKEINKTYNLIQFKISRGELF